jgi:phospholipase C
VTVGEFGFDFKRFGVRVPAVLVSPLISAGTVFRVANGATPLDHTSILKTVETRWNLPALTARDKAAIDLGAVLTLSAPRTDDPLAGVVVPKSGASPHSISDPPSHLEQIHAELVSRLPVPGAAQVVPPLLTSEMTEKYIEERTQAWKASRKRSR